MSIKTESVSDWNPLPCIQNLETGLHLVMTGAGRVMLWQSNYIHGPHT